MVSAAGRRLLPNARSARPDARVSDRDRVIIHQRSPALRLGAVEEPKSMQFEQFKSSLAGASPPAGISLAVQALWWQKKGDWHRAHRCCQDAHDQNGSWAHAYL